MMQRPINILIVEDSENDTLLLLRELKRAGFDVTYRRVDRPRTMRAALTERSWDLVISDHRMPHFNSYAALELMQKLAPDTPFIIVSGSIGEETAVEIIKMGATDYLLKDRLQRLGSAVNAALEQKRLREEKQQAEAQLRASEARFRTIFNQSLDVLLIVEPNTRRIVEANNAATHVMDYSQQALIGRPFSDLIPEEAPHSSISIIEGARTAGALRLTQPFHFAGQEVHPMDLTAVPISWDHSAVILVTLRDATERINSQHELERYRDHLEELVEARTEELEAALEQLEVLAAVKDEFVSNVSHELRNPISSLKLHLFLMEHDAAKFEKHMAVCRRETDRLERTIENLLRLSRLDQGRSDPVLQPVDLNHLIAGYVQDRRTVAEEQELTLTFEPYPDLPLVTADPGLLGQVIEVLLANALNYTPAGGTVRLRTKFRNHVVPTEACIQVEDSGPGIPQEEQEQIFERFFRGHASKLTETPGTGLGLAIAYEITAQHGGTIHAESAEGQGARFVVRLPANRS